MTSLSHSASSGSAPSFSASSPASVFSLSSSAPSATSSRSSRGEVASVEVEAVATLLRELEMLQDRAFAVCGRLMAALIDARIEQNIAPIVGKSIRAGISDVAVQISGAQGATADVHRLLEALAKARGLDVRLYGDTDKQDPRPGFTA